MSQSGRHAMAGQRGRQAAGKCAGWRAATLLAALLLAACSTPVPLGPVTGATGTAGASQAGTLDLDGQAHPVRWQRPDGPARALVVLAHGYTRRCANLDGTSAQLVAAGLMTLCIDAPMAGGGDPALADALAARLLDGADPAGQPWPQRLIVGGHSAGAVFALRLGARLADRAAARVVGAVLFDPVATPDFGAALARVSDQGRRPVLALMAEPHRCNARGNALPALQEASHSARAAGRDTLEVFEVGPGSTHADVEGDHSDWLAITACGRPAPGPVARVRTQAAAWARRVADGAAPEPGRPD